MNYLIQVPGAKSAGVLEVASPYDGKPVATVETIDEAGAERALKTASELFEDRGSWLPAHERVAILERTAELMRELAVQAAKAGHTFRARAQH